MTTFQEKTILLPNNQLINYIEVNPLAEKNIVFLHGNFSSWIWWNDILCLLEQYKNYRLIAIDQRGFGKSTYHNPVTRFLQHALDLKDFIQLKGLKNVTLIGWSYGGGVAMKTAEIAPELIEKIILTASVSHLGLSLTTQEGTKAYSRQQIQNLPRISFAQSIRKNKNYEMQKNIFNTVLFTKIPDYPDQKKNQLIQCSFVQAQYLDVLITLANSDIQIQKIKAKALMIHGRDDLVIKIDSVQETGALLGNCLEIWENHAHLIPIEDPKRYLERITKFIDE